MRKLSSRASPRAAFWGILRSLTLIIALCTGGVGWAKDFRVQKIDADHALITLEGEKDAIRVTGGDAAKALLKTINVGDMVRLPELKDKEVAASDIEIAKVPVGFNWIWALAVALIVVILYVFVVTRGNLSAFILGADNRYSNSKVQMGAWFGAVAVAYITTFLLRFWAGGGSWDYFGGIDLPTDLLTLMGLSGVSGGGAKVTTALKTAVAEHHNQQLAANPPTGPGVAAVQAAAQGAAQAAVPAAQQPAVQTVVQAAVQAAVGVATRPVKQAQPGDPRPWRQLAQDLTHNDQGAWDMGDVQMLLVTLLAIIAFAIAVGKYWGEGIKLVGHTTLPAVNVALTALFGGGLGAYLVKKIGGKPGEA